VAVNFFENTEWTNISGLVGSALNLTGISQFESDPLDLVFQRELIAYSLTGYYVQQPQFIRVPMEYVELDIFIQDPLNQSSRFTLASSIPPGAVFSGFAPERVHLPGQNKAVSISPLPIKRFFVVMYGHDLASIGNSIVLDLNLWWRTKKKLRFIGDEPL